LIFTEEESNLVSLDWIADRSLDKFVYKDSKNNRFILTGIIIGQLNRTDNQNFEKCIVLKTMIIMKTLKNRQLCSRALVSLAAMHEPKIGTISKIRNITLHFELI